MGLINLELRCPKNVNGISIDPNPSWNFNNLMSELSSLESKFYNNGSDSSINPKPFIKSPARDFRKIGWSERNEEKTKAFVMRVEDVEMDDFDDEDETETKGLVPSSRSRFTIDDIYVGESDDSDDEHMHQMQVSVMDKMGVVEGAFLELTHEHQLGVKEEIRNQLTTLETQLVAEKEKSTSALVQVEKNTDVIRQMDRKLDLHYQRKIAEALDNHLTAIQRDHEHRSQLEERKIRDDAALEEAKRKEKALQEEKWRQQKAKEDQEARLEAAKRAEEERKAAQEAEKLAKEAEDKLNQEKIKKNNFNAQNTAPTSSANVSKEVKSTGNLVRAAVNALKLEERRLQTYKELKDRNQSFISGSNTNLVPKERDIKRTIRQITGTIDNVRSKASKLVEILNDPVCPQSVAVAMFTKEVISIFETTSPKFNSSAFACGYVIVYVSSQVPAVMDCLLAEFHKACIYTVPKHIMYSKAAYETEETYYKALGYREENGKTEITDSYLDRIGSLMKLYGALVQTDAQGVQNMHGLEEGWAWLARFLNDLPPNRYTAVALEAFLEMAGFALHRKYKSQFTKVLDTISREFVPKLKARDPNAGSKISRIQEYIESKKFLQEPTGWRLQGALLSHTSVPEAEHRQQQYHHQPYQHTPDRRYTYHR